MSEPVVPALSHTVYVTVALLPTLWLWLRSPGMGFAGPHTSPLAQALRRTLAPRCDSTDWLLLRRSVDGR